MRPSVETVGVRYIGPKSYWKDKRSLYNSGLDFEYGQAREVPAHLGKSFLRHKDMFELAVDVQDKEEAQSDDTNALLAEAGKAREKAIDEQQDRLDLFIRVDTMDKSALTDYARVNFKVALDQRKSSATMATEVKGLIDQFGLP